MPQIAQLAETYSSQIFWLLVIFGFVFFVIGKGMVPKVMGTVELRDKQIGSDLAAAEAARNHANAEEEAWRKRENENRAQAQALIVKAKTEAANKAAENVYEAIRRDGHQKAVVDAMQTREDLYDRIGYHAFEQKLDALFAQKK